jgi:regulator of replication initiation timing
VFALFVFSGKLLLGNLTLLRTDFTIYRRRNQLDIDKIKKVSEWENEIIKLKADIEKYRDEKQAILPELSELKIFNNKLNARRDRLTKLFESEYQLAQKYRNKLTGKQIQEIISDAPQD